MASSSVKGNIILAITPTLDGVCGINISIFKFGQYQNSKFEIIYNNIPHTPSKVGVMARIIFSFTLDEAMSVGLAKACALR